MFSELLMGALVAVVAPQDPQVPEKAFEVEIPAIEIPEVDIHIPGIEFRVPSFDFHAGEWDFYSPMLELETPVIDIQIPQVRVPELQIHVPHVELWSDDWDESGFQEMETDTTFAVSRNAVLAVRNHAGEIVVRTWGRNEVRVKASHGSDDRVKIFQSEASVKIKSETRHGLPDIVDYEIMIPRSMPVDLWGFQTDISVDGAANGVRVETMSGDITIRDAGGEISVRSVEGDIRVSGSRGTLEGHAVDGEISVAGFEGELYVESIDGDVRLEAVSSQKVHGKTVDGDVFYTGAIRNGGRYRLTTHDGDVVVEIPEDVNATVSVATFDGEFLMDFPITIERAEATRRFSFTLGDGSARLELHSFDGDIQLMRR